MEQLEIKEYQFTFKHINRSVYRGTIKATSITNRDKIMLNLLFSRYRRKLPLKSIYGVVNFEEI